MRLVTLRHALAAVAFTATVGAVAAPADAAVTRIGKVVQEPSPFEARFPDLLKLDDGRIMAVWHRAAEHQNAVGKVQVAFDNRDNGRSWPERHDALADMTPMAGKDMRDPKLGKMHDGSVLLTWFVPNDGVYHSVWRPGWSYFAAPQKLTVPGISATLAEHGGIHAVDGSDQVLIPVYTGSGNAYVAKATYQGTASHALPVSTFHTLEATSQASDGRDEMWFEPSLAQFGDTIVAVVRHERWLRTNSGDRLGAPARVITWNANAATPTFTRADWNVQANSHHLLKTQDGRLLFTFGDRAVQYRPTYGTLISNPAQLPWRQPSAGQRVVPIYNSGFGDQANPSSVETTRGVFVTAAYNAKKYASSEGNGTSPSGGSLWLLQSLYDDYL
jgi:hypothetical protein